MDSVHLEANGLVLVEVESFDGAEVERTFVIVVDSDKVVGEYRRLGELCSAWRDLECCICAIIAKAVNLLRGDGRALETRPQKTDMALKRKKKRLEQVQVQCGCCNFFILF